MKELESNVIVDNDQVFDHTDFVGVGEALAHRMLNSWRVQREARGEVNNLPSMSVPNQSMTIREIFHRFASGQRLDIDNGLQYMGDDEFPDPRQFDIEELQEMIRLNAENMKRMEDELKQKSAANKEKAIAKQLADEAAKKQADIEAAVAANKDNK